MDRLNYSSPTQTRQAPVREGERSGDQGGRGRDGFGARVGSGERQKSMTRKRGGRAVKGTARGAGGIGERNWRKEHTALCVWCSPGSRRW